MFPINETDSYIHVTWGIFLCSEREKPIIISVYLTTSKCCPPTSSRHSNRTQLNATSMTSEIDWESSSLRDDYGETSVRPNFLLRADFTTAQQQRILCLCPFVGKLFVRIGSKSWTTLTAYVTNSTKAELTVAWTILCSVRFASF